MIKEQRLILTLISYYANNTKNGLPKFIHSEFILKIFFIVYYILQILLYYKINHAIYTYY